MNVWKSTRWAALAPAMLLALAFAAGPLAAHAQGTSTPAAPAPDAATAPTATPSGTPATTATPTPAGKQVEVVDNPYGLEAMWKGGDIVLKITLGILVFMSVGSWYVIIT
jgi:biopolymer transport protein ExbB